MNTTDYINAANKLNQFIELVDKRIRRQTVLDWEIQKVLQSYLITDNNSVSGNNFIRLISDLSEIKSRWANHSDWYLFKTGLQPKVSIK